MHLYLAFSRREVPSYTNYSYASAGDNPRVKNSFPLTFQENFRAYQQLIEAYSVAGEIGFDHILDLVDSFVESPLPA